MKRLGWFIFAFFAISIGLYPATYLFVDLSATLLGTKPGELLASRVWKVAFFLHIFSGGIALLTGWSQFIKNLRRKRLSLHRLLGRLYVAGVALSGISGLYIAFYATGGAVAAFGFSGLAAFWLFTTARAFLSIRKKDVVRHQNWMIRSYALTFAAVTLRIWLPLLQFGIGLEFLEAYRLVAWLCWIPNAFIAEMIVRHWRREVLTAA